MINSLIFCFRVWRGREGNTFKNILKKYIYLEYYNNINYKRELLQDREASMNRRLCEEEAETLLPGSQDLWENQLSWSSNLEEVRLDKNDGSLDDGNLGTRHPICPERKHQITSSDRFCGSSSFIDEEMPLEWALLVNEVSNMKGIGLGIVLEGIVKYSLSKHWSLSSLPIIIRRSVGPLLSAWFSP